MTTRDTTVDIVVATPDDVTHHWPTIDTADRRALVIDDGRTFRHDAFTPQPDIVIYARNSTAALEVLHRAADTNMLPYFTEIWFDHDLGEGDTSRPAALLLEERRHFNKPDLTDAIVINTDNGPGMQWLNKGLSRHWPTQIVDPKPLLAHPVTFSTTETP